MDFVDSELISVIYQLLPGFIAAWLFYGLTAHEPKSPFERTVQALIFTALIQAVVIPSGWLLVWTGTLGFTIGVWNTSAAFLLSIFVSIVLGLVFTFCANSGYIHNRLPDRITKRTSFPSEWFSAFNEDKRYIYLHLNGQRRLYGWPTEWPDRPGSGHFVMEEVQWILDDNTRVPLYLTKKLLIPATDVLMVEFCKFSEEFTHTPEQQAEAEQILIRLQRKENKDSSDG
ncbi:MAG: DUF6338 family protein [Planctomycetaceae bacterium]